MSVTKFCGHCKKEFDVPNRRSEQVRFCSIQCKAASGNKMVECVVCGVPFSCQVHKDRKYCSRTCYNASMKGTPKAIDPERPRYYKACEVCGKNFRVTLTRKDTARFCSRDCMDKDGSWKKAISEKMQGEKHWRWNGGEYLHKTGYVRYKKKVGNIESFVLSHRIVMARAIGNENPNHPFLINENGALKLSQEIEVHHIDRERSNNELSNLLAVTKEAHARIHHYGTKPKPWECWPSNPIAW